MSHFLLNLARRSAGLAPVVRARSTTAPIASEVLSATPGETLAPRIPAYAARAVAQPVTPPAAQDSQAANTHSARDLHGEEEFTAPSRELPTREAGLRPRDPEDRAPKPESDSPIPAQRIERSDERLSPVIVQETNARIEPALEPRPHGKRRDVVLEGARVIDRELRTIAQETPAVGALIRPAAPSAPSVRSPRSEAKSERTVHVRIGAIEIHGPEAGVGAPTTVSPAAAVSTTFTSAASGFDDYASLRSYAPWAW